MNQNYRTDLKHYANVVGIYLNSKYTIRHVPKCVENCNNF